jgi:hypothetical protein
MLKTTSGRYYASEKWIEKIFYREEALRGEACINDCLQPGYLEVEVKAGTSEKFAIIFVAGKDEIEAKKCLEKMPYSVYDVEALYEREIKRRENFLAKFYEEHVGILKKSG